MIREEGIHADGHCTGYAALKKGYTELHMCVWEGRFPKFHRV